MTREETDGSTRYEITYKWAIVTMLCLSPILLVFRHLGHYREGLGAWGCSGVLAYAIKNHWEMSGHQWFWMVVVLAIPLQIPFVLFFPWDRVKGYPAILPIAALYYAIVYGGFKLGEIIMARSNGNSA